MVNNMLVAPVLTDLVYVCINRVIYSKRTFAIMTHIFYFSREQCTMISEYEGFHNNVNVHV